MLIAQSFSKCFLDINLLLRVLIIKDSYCSFWGFLGSGSLSHLFSSSSTFSIVINSSCLWVSILHMFLGPPADSVSSALIPVPSLCSVLAAFEYPHGYWLGQPWAAHLRLNLFQKHFFSLWLCCFSNDRNSLRFSPIRCMFFSQSSSHSLLLNLQKRSPQAYLALFRWAYNFYILVPYTILFSD